METQERVQAGVYLERNSIEKFPLSVTNSEITMERWIRLLLIEIEQGQIADTFDLKDDALSHILKTAAMAQMCLEQFGLPLGKKQPVTIDDVNKAIHESGGSSPQPPFEGGADKKADSAATEPANDTDQGTSETLAPSHQ